MIKTREMWALYFCGIVHVKQPFLSIQKIQYQSKIFSITVRFRRLAACIKGQYFAIIVEGCFVLLLPQCNKAAIQNGHHNVVTCLKRALWPFLTSQVQYMYVTNFHNVGLKSTSRIIIMGPENVSRSGLKEGLIMIIMMIFII